MDESELSGLLDFVAGRGIFTPLGPGMRTFPGRDENNERMHAGCLELERRGLIKRVIYGPDMCTWRPIEPA